jgi:hypothetical protein
LAARFSGLPAKLFDGAFEAWGLAVKGDSAARVAKAERVPVDTKARPGRHGKGTSAAPSASGSFRDWTLVDELRLGLEIALVRFPGRGSRQDELLRGLSNTSGVRQILETARVRDVYAVLVFDGVHQRRALRARLEELTEDLEWDDVLYETHEPTAAMWRDLARRAAQAEGLSLDSADKASVRQSD